MKQLEVDLGELEIAFENASWENSYYLDLETGRIIWITEETHRELESIFEEVYDAESDEPVNLAEVLPDIDLRDWQKELVLEASEIERGERSRYLVVPQADSGSGYRDMEDFISTVEDGRLQDRLWRSIRGRGAFRRFKDILGDDPRERERWFAFKDEQTERRVREWLEYEGIEPVIQRAPPASGTQPTGPTDRALLIAEALAFVQAAIQLPGVTRIALLGSLTTEESEPDDVDLLVTVADDANLARLAIEARKLQGHAQSFALGGDVFLSGPGGRYLGRTCPWKKCGPSIRRSCDALHCGRRSYLHDDLETVRLPDRLIAAPPIELWPQVVARVPVPEDVEVDLLAQLREAEA